MASGTARFEEPALRSELLKGFARVALAPRAPIAVVLTTTQRPSAWLKAHLDPRGGDG